MASWDLVVLSPHFDDAALSVGGILARAQGSKAIVTVHGGAPDSDVPASWWDAACGFLTGREAYDARLDEDARACELLGAEQVVLPNADSPYRDGGPLSGLAELLGDLPSGTRVLIPLGTNQPDHAAVRDQALDVLVGSHGLSVLLYADLPYSGAIRGWGKTASATALADPADLGRAYREVQARYRLTVSQDIRLRRSEWPCKRSAVLCYASQLGPVAAVEDPGEGALLRWPGPLQSELTWELGAAREPERNLEAPMTDGPPSALP